MALYGMTQRNDAAPSAPTSTYGGMFARNDAPQASSASAPSAPGASETGYGRYGSRPRQDGGAWQGSRPGGTTGAIGGVRGGWGGAGGGWGQPGAGSIYANRQQAAPSSDWGQRQQSAPANYNGSQDQMNYAPAPTAADMNQIFTTHEVKSPEREAQAQAAMAAASNRVNQMNPTSGGWLSRPPSAPDPRIGNREAAISHSQSGGSALANATNWANQMNAASPAPSVVPGVKSGPDEYGGAPAQTPSVQFNTPFQRLGVSGYGAGNAAQGAFSEQTGQMGAPAPTLAPARSMPSFMPSPFVGPTYGQPMPSVSDAGGIYGPGAVPTGMSSRYARQPVMRTLY